jgi:quinoprotein glucose dehydrogenase
MFQAIAYRVVGALLLLVGLALTVGGGKLVTLGGSPYYLLAGFGCLAAGVQLVRKRRSGNWIYLAVFAATVIWSLAEVGLQFWQLLPRIAGPLVFALLCSALLASRIGLAEDAQKRRPLFAWGTCLIGGGLLLAAYLVIGPNLVDRNLALAGPGAGSPDSDTGNWTAFGRTSKGNRFSPADQITPDNVKDLKLLWSYRTGDSREAHPKSPGGYTFQVTPVKVGDKVFICTPHNRVIALDADSGAERWTFDPKLDLQGPKLMSCRGVSYVAAEANGGGEGGACADRIITATGDARLIALDPQTGKPCEDFGMAGQVSLLEGMGSVKKGFYYVTSPPVIVNGLAVLGGFVMDNAETGEPSGVIRAYDVKTGALRWAWDSGQGAEPATGSFTRGSPNAWSVLSADPDLGLVYVPTGNPTPDYFGGQRSPELERYGSSVVALDAQTGKLRWAFQTTHHDLWDYDVPAQPALFTWRGKQGEVPAVAVATKRGEIYLLDRRTGEPLHAVEERKVPRGDIPGERYSATQPYSGFPGVRPAALRERDMWGVTPLDQMLCRIEFRSRDYVGDFTPPSVRGSISYPGQFGIINWGGVAIDEQRQVMVFNSAVLPQLLQLVPRDRMKQLARKSGKQDHSRGLNQQAGTPYGVYVLPFLSPLGVPCSAPPWGNLTAIDIARQEVLWQRPLGTSADTAPLGIAVPGIFNTGGTTVTKSGLAFIGATMDHHLRAFSVASGKELWRARLPAAANATPATFTTPKGRQIVVIAAGGHEVLGSPSSDHVMAFALPDGTKH